jgi:putative acetyltransferase
MRTAPQHLRKGVAAQLLGHLIDVARARGMERLNLETGSGEPFAAARALYVRFGFVPCGPFADYTEDPLSVYFTRGL